MEHKIQPNGWALAPLVFFLLIYLGTSLLVHDFYKMPITVAFLLSSVIAVAMMKGKMAERIARFSAGASDKNILTMIWIFVLAGAFAQSAREMGAIDATVALMLKLLPGQLLLAGLFLASCFISLVIGTSVGTIAALAPIAIETAAETDINMAFMVAIVAGGAFFGDNLSFISDTTIAATKTQGCDMRDKFRVNIRIVLPAALLLLVYYIFAGTRLEIPEQSVSVEWIKTLPYLAVLGTALAGMNVILVLMLGLFITGITGIVTGGYDLFGCLAAMGTGITGMGELIIITLMAGGMLESIRSNGGIEYILEKLTAGVRSKRGAELGIAALVSVANLGTANNTIAIITTGPIARNITERFGLDPRKTASILDTFSCFIQGLIPYGAQVLLAAKLAGISPLSIVGYLYYPMLLGGCALAAVLFRYPRKYSAG